VKDLYKRNCISPSASVEVLRQFLASQPDSEDRAAARQILQVEHRRRVYDRVRETYATFGAVAANLRVSAEIPEDFRQHPSAFGAQIPRYLKRYRRKSLRRKRGILTLFLVFGAVGIVFLASEFHKSSNYAPQASIHQISPTLKGDIEPRASQFPTVTPRFQQSFPTPQFPTPPRFQQFIPTPTPFDPPAKPLPKSGIFWTLPSIPRIAPFKITTQSGSRYFIKLVDAYTKDAAILIFVDGAQTIQVDVPLGTFELRYASGWVWYGTKYRFGPTTHYTKGMEFLTFTQAGNYVSGNEVTLYNVPDGNFETTEIDGTEF
jgi:hypothetical protein